MTETESTTTTEPTTDTGTAPGGAEVETEGAEKSGAEAARYRVKLRETEAERDTLRGRVESLQQRQVEQMVADRLAQPADLLAFGVTLADLLDADGEIDPGLVDTAAFGLLESRPGLAKTAPTRKGPTAVGHAAPSTTGRGSWSDLLQNPTKA